MTDQYAVFGNPVQHSWSPFIHGLFAKQTGQDLSYRKQDVAPADLAQRVSAFFTMGGRGLNLTAPHKSMGAVIADQLTPRAETASAVNTLAWEKDANRVLGDNTDGVGMVRDLRDNIGLQLADKRILICGAGGATRGVLAPLLAEQVQEVVIANRSVGRAQLLAETFRTHGSVRGCGYEDVAAGPPFDLVINATSAGLRGELPQLLPTVLDPETICYDMSYSKSQTLFCDWAIARGCREVYQGWGLLVEQAAESFLLWRGVRPETAPVLAVLLDHNS